MTGVAFTRRTYECQWQVVIQPVDQYGKNYGPETVLSRWPTREEALKNRPLHGSEQNHRYVPFGGTGYENLNVVYREIPVETASPEIAALTAERDEADRRAGAAERRNAELQDGAFRRTQWLDKAKRERGFNSWRIVLSFLTLYDHMMNSFRHSSLSRSALRIPGAEVCAW